MSGWSGLVSYSFFASVALKSSLMLAVAGLGALLLRRRSAAVRHLLWTAALMALLALPFLAMSIPVLRVPLSPVFTSYSVVSQTASTASWHTLKSQPGAQARTGSRGRAGAWTGDWRMLLIAVWALGVATSFGQMLAAWAMLRRIRRAAHPLAVPEVTSLTRRLGIRSRIELLEARRECMPMTFGLLRSQIFLPAGAAEWDQERRGIVILHEIAHVMRRDCATHLLARAALAVFWWNPLAWIAWREFLKERERAADDLVLSTGARPSDYANHLLEIASGMQSTPALGWAAVAIARRSQLEGRLLAILDNSRDRRAVRRLTAISGAAVALAIAAPLAALQSQGSTPSGLGTDPAAVLRSAATSRDPESLDRAARAAEDLGQYDVAQKLLESALALHEQRSGRQSAEYGAGLLKLADLEREQGNFDAAQSLYTRALSSLGGTPEAATALIHMGAIALSEKKNVQAAIDDFARAQVLDPADAGRSDMWLAIAQEQQGNTEQADTSYQSALKKQDPNSEGAATVLELYAQFLSHQGRQSEAKSMRGQSLAIRKTLGAQAMSMVRGDGATVYKVGGDVSAPVLLSKVEPGYSPDARAAKYQGPVLVYAEVGADGLAHDITVSRGLGLGLNEKAVQAIRQWKFRPATRAGQPVTVGVHIEVNFRLL